MKRFIVAALLIIVMVLFVSNVGAFSIKIMNDSKQLLNYKLIWNECDWEGFPKNTAIAGGEIQSEAINDLGSSKYKGGKYTMEWSGKNFKSRNITIQVPNKGILILKAMSPSEFHKGI